PRNEQRRQRCADEEQQKIRAERERAFFAHGGQPYHHIRHSTAQVGRARRLMSSEAAASSSRCRRQRFHRARDEYQDRWASRRRATENRKIGRLSPSGARQAKPNLSGK